MTLITDEIFPTNNFLVELVRTNYRHCPVLLRTLPITLQSPSQYETFFGGTTPGLSCMPSRASPYTSRLLTRHGGRIEGEGFTSDVRVAGADCGHHVVLDHAPNRDVQV